MLEQIIQLLINDNASNTIARLFSFISFKSALAVIFSLFVTNYFGKYIIKLLRKRSVGENIRELGLHNQSQKKGTPTMGGLIILLGILTPTFLLCDLQNIYVQLMIITTIWMGFIGFVDDYIKVFQNNKKGLAGRFKIFGQIVLGCFVAGTLYFNSGVITHELNQVVYVEYNEEHVNQSNNLIKWETGKYHESQKTTIPFNKNNEFTYNDIASFFGLNNIGSFIIYLLIIVFIITAVSNGSNLTDGIDGLAAGTCAIIGSGLVLFSYVSSNVETAGYLNIMFIPNSEELVIFMSAFVGSCVGFLWYNSFPAQIFMGDTGSLSLGAIIAVCAIAIRKELMIPIFCGIFFLETLSVVLQVSYYKYTKKRYGIGKRIFLMSPIHHHFQKKGIHESKITTRFWIVCVFLIIIAFVTLKIR